MSRQWWDTVLLCISPLSGFEGSCLDWILGPILLSNLCCFWASQERQAEFVRSYFNKGWWCRIQLNPNGPGFMTSQTKNNIWTGTHKAIRNKESWMGNHCAWCWFPSPVITPVRPGPVLSWQMHTTSDASSKEAREASGNVGCTQSVHTPQEKQSRQRQPCSEQAKQGQHESEGSLGYVHRWWRAGRTLHLPFDSVTWLRRLIFPCERVVQSLCSEEIAGWGVKEVWTRA